ncbi:sugar nucleotide-binding protein [Cellulophaga sp. 20_2_10]|uniref:sugar nucleotide-binding protein n=1 Tax=Cellulophaga sp. 20_2_10 TaxID=2942476 RepID=UPI00201B1A48|nr:sugar nucleotide-binding protein [Cellulophaga sp. 20_2_10]MCL5246060.1 sugar nucleotide-binding protein [Cellulophaga sp. 20_2_10]
MKENKSKNKILILGASGFIGNAIYKELYAFYDTYGTYCTNEKGFKDNGQFFYYNVEETDIYELLEIVKPDYIISAIRGNFAAQVLAHQHIIEYVTTHKTRLLFLSSANVFDAYSKYPSYELDKTLSLSIYGRLKIKIENMLLRLPKSKAIIVRLPMVFGNNTPRIKEIKTLLHNKEPIEVFPNLVFNVTHIDKLTQQLHYIINHNKTGIFHLGSEDLVHHEDFIKEIISKIGLYNPVYKRVFTSNEDRYLAVLPKSNKLPKHLRTAYQDTIDHHLFS